MSQRAGILSAIGRRSPGRDVIVLRPPGRIPELALGELWRRRAVLFALARRSLMVRYRQTLIGATWVLLQPIALTIVFTAFFGLLARVPSQGIPYPVFVLIGLLVWHKVAKILSEGSSSITGNTALVTRIYFPRVYFPVSVAMATMIDLAVGVIPLLGLLIYFGIIPGAGLALVPFFLLISIVAAVGATFWLSALQASYHDVANMMPFLTQVWFFLSPIIYPSSIVPESVRVLYYLNPMAVAIDGLRWAFTGTPLPSAAGLIAGTAVAILMLASGYVFFRKREPTFADTL